MTHSELAGGEESLGRALGVWGLGLNQGLGFRV